MSEGASVIDLHEHEVDIASVRARDWLIKEGVISDRDVILVQVELESRHGYVLALLFDRVEVGIHSLVQGVASNVGERGVRCYEILVSNVLPCELVKVIL